MPNSILGLFPFDHPRETSPAVLQALSEAAAWCSRQQLLVDQLRCSELDPSTILNIPHYSHPQNIELWLDAKRDSYHRAVSAINKTRSALLRDANTAIPDVAEAQSKGKLLLYEPLETVEDGAAEATSRGFFDGKDAPPWDTWFLYSNGTIFSWVPESLISYAQAGIDANPVDCIHWANWFELARHKQ